MIPLFRNQFPSSKAELAEALNDALGRYVKKEAGPLVTVSARVFPYLDEIAVNLDGAELASSFPRLQRSSAKQNQPSKPVS